MSKSNGTPGWLRELCTRRPWTTRDAHRVLDELEASGETVGEFAARVGLVSQRLYWWRDRLSAERRGRSARSAGLQMAELVPVAVRAVASVAAEQNAPVEVIAGQAEVRFRVNDLSPATASWVAAMLRSLHEGRS